MFREQIFKFFLATRFLREIARIFISIKYRKKRLSSALSEILNTNNKSDDKNFSEYQSFKSYNWLIQICAPSGEKSKYWGDTHFANEVATALIRLGQTARVIYRDQEIEPLLDSKTIILNIRGIIPLPTHKNHINIVWVISHPNQLTGREFQEYDLAFAASEFWAEKKSKSLGIKITPLLQATNPQLFNTKSAIPNQNSDLLFVGNTRGEFRNSVEIASKCSKNLKIIGKGWEKYLPKEMISQNYIDNAKLSGEYRKARFVLSDQWKDMTIAGFIPNRLFDAVASGARVISEHIIGLDKIFGNTVIQYKSKFELTELLNSDLFNKFQSQEEIDQKAIQIQNEHNFDNRAKILIANAKQLISQLN